MVLAVRGEQVVLAGAVASVEEADRSVEVVTGFGVPAVNRLQTDGALREGIQEPSTIEPVEPADPDEVLTGGPDVLAGPEATITDDVTRALDENEPLEPPEQPLFPPTPGEARRARTVEPEEPTVDADEAADDRPTAADLTAQDLHEAAAGHPLPSLDPELDTSQDDSGAEPAGVDELGATPSDAEAGETFPSLVPGTELGPGAVGEPTTEGGGLGGTPGTETGAVGADTVSADPARGALAACRRPASPAGQTRRTPPSAASPGRPLTWVRSRQMPHVTFENTRIDYLDDGQHDADVTVLFLHAFPLNARMWNQQISWFADRCRVIAPDFRGFGNSDLPTDPARQSVESHADDVYDMELIAS